MNEKQQNLLFPILIDLFESTRDLMNVHVFGGKVTSRFNLLLSRYCRLSLNYHGLKNKVKSYVDGEALDSNVLFD